MKKPRETWQQVTYIILSFVGGMSLVYGLAGQGKLEYFVSGALGGLVAAIARRVLRGSWWY